QDYDEAWRNNGWQAQVVACVGANKPAVLMVHAGQALIDLMSNQGENGSGIENHFIAALGYHPGGASDYAGGKVLPAGLWCADGASYAGGNNRGNGFGAADVLQFYSFATLYAAWPVAYMAVEGYQATTMAWVKQSDGSGKDDKGNVCGSGTLDALLAANMGQFDGRMSETHYSASGVADVAFLPLVNGAVFHAVQQNAGGAWVQDQNAAQVAMDLYELATADATALATAKTELTAADASLASANDALQAANVKIAALEQQLQQLQQQQPPVSDPTAAALVAAIKAALAA
ncbi:MAG TPA: hypothetical protein VMV29_11330, partial [Ktedonobacterales bacterium]|nr:hypothetical protein [Ktedonobacterales bacterium]